MKSSEIQLRMWTAIQNHGFQVHYWYVSKNSGYGIVTSKENIDGKPRMVVSYDGVKFAYQFLDEV